VNALQKLYDDLPEPFCACCQFGNHTEPCTCDGVHECCHPQAHFRRNAADRRTFPEIVGVYEAAVIMGLSKQRVHQLMENPKFPLPVARLKCGPVFLAQEIEAFHATRNRVPGFRAAVLKPSSTDLRGAA
jgi:hypothetical protein